MSDSVTTPAEWVCPCGRRSPLEIGELLTNDTLVSCRRRWICRNSSHDPSGVVFTVLAALSGMEREYIRDRTLEGHESARARGKTIGGAAVTDDAMLSMALHLRQQNLSLRDIAARLVLTKGKKRGRHPSPATVLRMLREHDEADATVPSAS
ncbi:hypothetical protein ACIA8R_52375 [Nonomuraea sp. NPDC051191]|uniref:hypothetical protein n=1 Tax=Nonomuraea sp. NPDC051191 TaxID=3364372 RepID=UPI0037BC3A5B